MKQSLVANIAVALAALSWPLIAYGLLSMLGDYRPGTPQEMIDFNHALSVLAVSTGFLCFIAALWLAGYSFAVARLRSLLTVALCVGLISFGVWGFWL